MQELTERLKAALQQAASEEQKRKELGKYSAKLANALDDPQKDIPSKKLDMAKTASIEYGASYRWWIR